MPYSPSAGIAAFPFKGKGKVRYFETNRTMNDDRVKITILSSLTWSAFSFPVYLPHFWGEKEGECDSASSSRIYGDALKKARGIFCYQYQLNAQ